MCGREDEDATAARSQGRAAPWRRTSDGRRGLVWKRAVCRGRGSRRRGGRARDAKSTSGLCTSGPGHRPFRAGDSGANVGQAHRLHACTPPVSIARKLSLGLGPAGPYLQEFTFTYV
jgi:hypothetical protein